MTREKKYYITWNHRFPTLSILHGHNFFEHPTPTRCGKSSPILQGICEGTVAHTRGTSFSPLAPDPAQGFVDISAISVPTCATAGQPPTERATPEPPVVGKY